MDRCALFVDAGYVLADGAAAVHGTRRGEPVSWDREGLVQLLSSLARERTGLPVLRCYWYEATIDGRRTAEQDALADVPGIKLRVAKIRPGRREGVETEIHRDLTTLARNNAISDALLISAEEDLAQVIADVQYLGMRVTLMHIMVDGNWTVSRALRQESDDIIEISRDHLRPYVELIAGAEPPSPDSPDDVDDGRTVSRPLANGHSTAPAASYQVPAAAANHAPPAGYTAPAVAEYQRPEAQLPMAPREVRDPRDDRVREESARDDRVREGTRDDRVRAGSTRDDRVREERARDDWAREERLREEQAHEERAREEQVREERAREERAVPPAVNGEGRPQARPDVPARSDNYGASLTGARNRPDRQETAPQNPAARPHLAEEVPGYPPGRPGAPEPAPPAPATAEPPPAQLHRLPSSRHPGSEGPAGPSAVTPMPGQYGGQGQGLQGGQGAGRTGPYSGPQPVLPSTPSAGGYQPGGEGVSLSDAVQAAHEEGQEFGGAVARDAPALWLEAVLARKPRMPSDLEARLLQGSALPIDFLLHDEVRHALRRGFWDALERTRR